MTRILCCLCLLIVTTPRALWAGQCNITSTPLSFGVYDTLDPAATLSTASLSVSCKNPPQIAATVTIVLSAGNSGSFAQRHMSNTAGATLIYNLYTDSNLASVFGDGSGGSRDATATVDKFTPWTLVLYGQIPPLQKVPAGSYSDTLTATILW